MKAYAHDFTGGRLAPQLVRFSLPLILSNVLQALFNMSDVAVVGRFAGPIALGAVGSTSTLVFLFTGFLMGLGGGVNAQTARCFGAKNTRDVRESVHSAALICLITGIALLLAGMFFSPLFLELLGTKEDLFAGAVRYMRIYFLGMPAIALYNFGSGVLSAIGDTQRPLRYLTIAGVLNVVLNLFFVIICKLDVAGVAIASTVSQYVSAGLILRSLLRSGECYALRLSALRFYRGKTGRILAIGLPTALQNSLFALANLFVQGAVNTFDTVMVEGNSAAANADALVYDVMAAIYTGCSSFIGQNLGAGKMDRVRRSYLVALAFSFGAGAVMGGALLVFGRSFLAVFTSEPAVIEMGMRRLSIMGVTYGVSAFMDCTIAACRGLGRTVVATVLVILGSVVFRIAWIYTVFAYYHTIPSLYLLYVFSWSLTAIPEILYFVHCYRSAARRLAPVALSA